MNWKEYERKRLGRELTSLSVDEEIFLFSVIDDNEDLVLEELLKCNFGLIHKICHKYVPSGVCYEDLFASGMMGLVVAAKKFDLSKGNRFSTYSYYWILQKVQRCVESNSSVIKLPGHIKSLIRQIESYDGDVLDLVILTGKTIGNVKNALKARDLDILSIDEVGEDGEFDFSEVLSSDSEDPLFDSYLEKERVEIIMGALDRLDEYGRMIILYKFGLGVDKLSEVEICDELQIDRNYYVECLSDAMSILRSDDVLKSYFDIRR